MKILENYFHVPHIIETNDFMENKDEKIIT